MAVKALITDETGKQIVDAIREKAGLEARVSDLEKNKVDKSSIAQTTGDAEDKVMSQKAATEELEKKFDKSNVVQSTGDAEDKVMSQAAATKEFDKLSEEIVNQRTPTRKGSNYKPILEQGAYDDISGVIVANDNATRVRNISPVFVNKKTLTFNIPEGISVWVYELDENLNLVGQSTSSLTQEHRNKYYFKSDYALFVLKWTDTPDYSITPSDIDEFYIKDYYDIIDDNNIVIVPMERGGLVRGGYSNSNLYSMRRSAFPIRINGAKFFGFDLPVDFEHKFCVVYFYDKNMNYLSWAQQNNFAETISIPDGCEYVKFYVETYECVDYMSIRLVGATKKPTFAKNPQIIHPIESVVFDTATFDVTKIDNGFMQGYIRPDGTEGSDPARVYTGFVKFEYDDNVNITVADGFSMVVVAYTDDGTFVEKVGTGITGIYTLDINNAYKYRFVLVKDDESTLTPNDLPKDVLKCTYTVYDFTTSRLILPPNYTVDGKPVPLILWMDGSGNFTSWDDDLNDVKIPYLQYLADDGFAVFSVFAWGQYYDNKYPRCGMAYPYVVPTNLNAIKRGLEYICDRFNIDPNNIHVMSKSQGGQVATYFVSNPIWDFKSIGMFSPVNDYLSMPGEALYSKTRAALVEEMGLIGDTAYFMSTEFNACSDAGRAFWEQNKVRIAGMNEAWTNLIGGTLDENFNDAMNDCKTFWTERRWNNATNPDIYNKTSYVKLGRVPVKIWGTSDDASTPYGKMVEVVAQLQNGGTEAHLREMPRGTGGHSSPDVDGIKQDITTALGITHTNIPVGWIENVEWIRSKMPK